MIHKVVLVSAVQQSDSVIRIHVPILFQSLFPHRLLQNIDSSSLFYIADPGWLHLSPLQDGTCDFPGDAVAGKGLIL